MFKLLQVVELMKYRVIHVNASLKGGAATGSQRVHRSLLAKGIESVFVSSVDGPDETYRRIGGGPLGPAVTARYLIGKIRCEIVRRWQTPLAERILRDREDVFSHPTGLWRTWLPADLFADGLATVVNLHWLGGKLDYRSLLASIPARVPIVWTLRDMHPFTGGCHIGLNCQGYARGCVDCPIVKHEYRHLPGRNLALKRRLLAGRKVCAAGISKWITGEGEKSSVFPEESEFRCLPNGIDTDLFRPVPKAAAKECLGLSGQELVVCFGADRLCRKEKGFGLLLEALTRLASTGVQLRLLTFGDGEIPELPFGVTALGLVRGEPLQRIIYSAADVFAMPSIWEPFGNTCVEAMSCGVPVAGFRVGGVIDQVEEEVTGLLVEAGDVQGLGVAIGRLLENEPLRASMGRASRKRVETQFSMGLLAQRYQSTYEQLLGVQE